MIEFSGQLSPACQEYMVTMNRRGRLYASIFMELLMSIPVTILTLTDDRIYAIFYLPLLILFSNVFFRAPKNSYEQFMPKSVAVENETISAVGKKFFYTRDIVSVKKVVDRGEWYHIYFYFPKKCECFVCEKCLLTKGTLEEFEELFAESLVKAPYKKRNDK